MVPTFIGPQTQQFSLPDISFHFYNNFFFSDFQWREYRHIEPTFTQKYISLAPSSLECLVYSRLQSKPWTCQPSWKNISHLVIHIIPLSVLEITYLIRSTRKTTIPSRPRNQQCGISVNKLHKQSLFYIKISKDFGLMKKKRCEVVICTKEAATSPLLCTSSIHCPHGGGKRLGPTTNTVSILKTN